MISDKFLHLTILTKQVLSFYDNYVIRNVMKTFFNANQGIILSYIMNFAHVLALLW